MDGGGFVKVVYPFIAARDDELSVSEGDVVRVLERLDDNWSRGESRYGMGVFPINHATPFIRDISSRRDAANGGRRQEVIARAVFDFNSDSKGDLRFRENDVIEVIREVNEEWLEGRLSGMCGIFPKSFVKLESKTTGSVTQNGRNHFGLKNSAVVLRNEMKPIQQSDVSAVVLREKRKPVPRPRTVVIPKSDIVTDSTESLVTKDDLFVKQTAKPEPRPRIASCPKPTPRPRPSPQPTVDINMTSAVNVAASVDITITSSAITEHVVGIGSHSSIVVASPLLNGFETCHVIRNSQSADAFTRLFGVGTSKPAVKPKPRVATKPPVTAKPSVKVRQCQSHVTRVSPTPATKQTAAIEDVGVSSVCLRPAPHRPAPRRPTSQIVLAASMTSELCVDVPVSQRLVSCSGLVKPKPRRRNVSREFTEEQDEEQHLLSPSLVKVSFSCCC